MIMAEYDVALGSNLGDRKGYLYAAVEILAKRSDIGIKKVSSVYETEPVGYTDQGAFLNAAIKVEAAMDPVQFLHLLLETEIRLGRTRTFRNAPRTIDLDLLFAGNQVIEKGMELVVPHPRLHERAFVLAPLMEIAATQVHPVLKSTVAEIYDRVEGKEGVRWYSTLLPNDSVPTGNLNT